MTFPFPCNAVRVGACLAASLGFVACGAPENPLGAVTWPSREGFERDVQPILAEDCANPSCHGARQRPFRLYAPLRWRAEPQRTHRVESLSEAELMHNLRASALFGRAEGRELPLLLAKPLADAVGIYHGGDTVWQASEYRFRVVRDWLATRAE